jgi:ABC-type phosphate/phosphonate transport system substrate-binding protein
MVTWLAPGLPLALFDKVRETIQTHLSAPVSLEARTKLSGPEVGSADPFADGRAEVGFLCAPAAVPTAIREQGGFELLNLAPVFDDVRYAGQPHCYCDIVVREDTMGAGLDDLRGMRFGYNDPSSLSGWLGLSVALQARKTRPEAFFGSLVQTGGHLRSLQQLQDQSIQVASIDSNVLHTHPDALKGLKIIESIGPWPSQPVVVRRTLSADEKARIKQALNTCGPWPDWGFVGFAHQDPAHLAQVPTAALNR